MTGSKTKTVVVSLAAAGVIVTGGFDAATFERIPLPAQTVTVAGEQVRIKQSGNVVEATLPWKGEKGLTVKYDLGNPSLAERLKDKSDKQIVAEPVGDGAFKIDILLNDKPKTNTFCYTIEGHEDYDFFYQPPLTQEEIDAGSIRPEEIVGSYAVYHKALKNNQYKTGKVLHIPFPYVWEVGKEDQKVRAENLTYEEGSLCVVAPQEFLDNADYTNGVRIDPTLGYTSLGATLTANGNVAHNSGTNSGATGETYNLATAGTLDSIHLGLKKNSGDADTVDLFAALYREDSAGADSHDLVVGIERTDVSVDTTGAFFTFTAASEELTADDYILAGIGDGEDMASGGVYFASDTGSAINQYRETTLGAGGYATRKAEDPWTETDGSSTDIYSVYITYTGGSTDPLTNIFLKNNSGTLNLNSGTTVKLND